MNELASDAILTVEFLVEAFAKSSLILLRQIGLSHQLVFAMSECTLKRVKSDRITYSITKRAVTFELPIFAKLCAELLVWDR